jgi:uncharacterized BrkB/YihY/UPF0761 family membrane protein
LSPAPRPPERPRGRGWWPILVSLVRYLGQTEVHTYAFSVAANAILSIFPFIVMMFTIARQVFHSPMMVQVIEDMLHDLLPSNQAFVVRNMSVLVRPSGGVQLAAVVTLLISSSGVFLPLEVALNRVWGVAKNRSYLHNQVISLGVAFTVAMVAMVCVFVATAQTGLLTVLFLPNRKLPLRAVLPAAIVTGLTWDVGRLVYMVVLPHLDLHSVYGAFDVSVSLMIWAFLTGLLLLAGAQYSATRHTLRLAHEADLAAAREAEENDEMQAAHPAKNDARSG